MATSKAPKHDFAPAWLKIPDQDSAKPSGPKSADYSDKLGRPTRKDDYYNYNRYGSSDYMYAPLQRQRSFDNYYDERRYSPQKFRHHSVDDDYYNAAYGSCGYGYYNGYYSDNYGNHYRSQPSLYRDAGKYTHPNARYGQGPPAGLMNGAYPPYYDPYVYEYYGDPYYPSYMHRSGGNGGSKRGYPEKDRSNNKGEKEVGDSRDSDHRPVSRKRSSSIEDEFPSLKVDVECIEKSAKPVNGSTVWDKPPLSKPLSASKLASVDSAAVTESTNTCEQQVEKSIKLNGSTFKTFKVASKANKEVKAGKDLNSNTSKSPSPPSKVFTLETSKEGSKPASSPPIEILNARLVTQPKNLADKKSDFLKALRQENLDNGLDLNAKEETIKCLEQNQVTDKECGAIVEVSQKTERLTNGVTDLSIGSPIDGDILSSSLEAEQRLLREMGWNEEDDEDYVITEDDVREFEKLSKELKEQRNGFKKTLPSRWSPQHMPPIGNLSVKEMSNEPVSNLPDERDSDLD